MHISEEKYIDQWKRGSNKTEIRTIDISESLTPVCVIDIAAVFTSR